MRHIPSMHSSIHRAALALALLCGLGAMAPDATAQVDFSPIDIEVNQAIQSAPGNIPLTGGRSTFVRTTVRMVNPPVGAVFIDGIMRIFVDGIESADSPIYSDNGPFEVINPPNPVIENGTLNFIFIPPVSNDVVLSIEVNPAGPNFVAENNTSNNIRSTAQLTFGLKGIPELQYAPIDYRPSGGPTPNLPDPGLIEPGVGDNFMQAIYPGSDWFYRRTDAPSKLWTSSLSGTGSNLLNSLNADIALMSPQPDFLYGWVPGSLPYNGQAQGIPGVSAMGNTEPIRHQRTFAHEIGHNFGLSHNSTIVNLIGVDVEHHLNLTESLAQIKASNLNDIMTPGLLTPQAWVANTNYNFFHNHNVYNPTEEASTDGGPTLLVSGLWNTTTGSVETTHVVTVPTGRPSDPDPVAQADLLLRSFAGGAEIGALPIIVRDSADDGAACHDVDADSPFQPSPIVAFSAFVPATTPGGALIDRILVEQAGARTVSTLQLERSAAAPEVTFTSPAPGPIPGGQITVAWNGSDADGDPLAYYLRYSPNGTRFVPLATAITETQFEVDLTQLPGLVDGQGFFELLTSDGLNTTVVRTDPLTGGAQYAGVGGNAPWVEILAPDNGFTYQEGGTVILHSSGWDLEDGGLTGTDIEWSSDLDGVLGNGRLLAATLSDGVHVITVEATDSGGAMTTDSATITVINRDLPGSVEVCQTDIGFGGPGSSVLTVCGGDLSTGTTADAELTGAPASTQAFVFAGLVNDPTFLEGGTLVPVPWVALKVLSTDGSGQLTIPNIPGGGGPFSAYLQVIVVDGAQTFGYGFSNAVQVDFLP